MFDCKTCGSEVIRSYGSKIKLRTNIVLWENGKCVCKCLKCKAWVELPLFLELPTGKIIGKTGVKHSEKRKKA
jgi:hypothetical protein